MDDSKTATIGLLVIMLIASLPQTISQTPEQWYGEHQDPSPINEDSIAVEITKPLKGYLYINDQQKAPLKIVTLILGALTIEAKITGKTAQRVEFYLDEKLQHTAYGDPYTWVWEKLAFFRHTLTVVAYDYNGTSAEQQLPLVIFDIKAPPKQLSRDDAINILRDQVIHPNSLDHTVYAFTLAGPLQQGDKTAPWLPDPLPESVEQFPYLVYRESQKPEWFFWVDDVPRAKFQHDVRFVYIDAVTGTVEVHNEQWWPVLNDVSLWNSSEDYWNTENWAFTNDDIKGPPIENLTRSMQVGEDRIHRSPGENGVIIINGWSRGQPGKKYFEKDADGMGLFWESIPGFDTVKVLPPDNKQSSIHNAFNDTGDNRDVVVYISSHGGIDSAGEPFVSCGNEKVTEDELCDMAREHSNTTYKWIIDACHSGAFISSLKNLSNTAIIHTACNATEHSKNDWDPVFDPNPYDSGGEFSSGYIEDLWKAWLNNTQIGILELLKKAYESAVAKDAGAINGTTHPQHWERPDTVSPVVVITHPLNNTHVMDHMINITGYANDSLTGVGDLGWFWEWDGGNMSYNWTVAPPVHLLGFDFMIAPLNPGWNRVTVIARDIAGNSGNSSIVIYYDM